MNNSFFQWVYWHFQPGSPRYWILHFQLSVQHMCSSYIAARHTYVAKGILPCCTPVDLINLEHFLESHLLGIQTDRNLGHICSLNLEYSSLGYIETSRIFRVAFSLIIYQRKSRKAMSVRWKWISQEYADRSKVQHCTCAAVSCGMPCLGPRIHINGLWSVSSVNCRPQIHVGNVLTLNTSDRAYLSSGIYARYCGISS